VKLQSTEASSQPARKQYQSSIDGWRTLLLAACWLAVMHVKVDRFDDVFLVFGF